NFQQFFPRGVPAYIKTNFITTQFVTGHGAFQNYLYRINISPTNICPCGQSPQTPIHLLTQCTLTSQFIIQLIGYTPTEVTFYTKTKQNFNTYIKICYYIHNTHLLVSNNTNN